MLREDGGGREEEEAVREVVERVGGGGRRAGWRGRTVGSRRDVDDELIVHLTCTEEGERACGVHMRLCTCRQPRFTLSRKKSVKAYARWECGEKLEGTKEQMQEREQ